MHVTTKPRVTTLVMAENHIKTALGCATKGVIVHSARMARAQLAHYRGKLGILVPLAIFLPLWTILHPHSVAQHDVSPPPPKPAKALNCNLSSTLQHSGQHMHNRHI